jgi:hypothetical protein
MPVFGATVDQYELNESGFEKFGKMLLVAIACLSKIHHSQLTVQPTMVIVVNFCICILQPSRKLPKTYFLHIGIWNAICIQRNPGDNARIVLMLKIGILMTSAFSATWWMSDSGDWWHLAVRTLCAIGIAYAIFIALMLLAEQRRVRNRRSVRHAVSRNTSLDALVRFHRDNETRR